MLCIKESSSESDTGHIRDHTALTFSCPFLPVGCSIISAGLLGEGPVRIPTGFKGFLDVCVCVCVSSVFHLPCWE